MLGARAARGEILLVMDADLSHPPDRINDLVAPLVRLRRDIFASRFSPVEAGADDGIRTRDLRFTKPLLYQLSYVGKRGQTLHRGEAVAIAQRGDVAS